MLKKLVVVIFAVLAVAAVATVAVFKSTQTSQVLSYVPEDTLYFYGNAKPQNLGEIIARAEDFGYNADSFKQLAALSGQAASQSQDDDADTINDQMNELMAGYYQAMAELMENKTLANAFFVDYALYEVEGMPVLRFALPPLTDVWTIVDDIESAFGLYGDMYQDYGGMYREYTADELQGFSVIVAEIDQQLIVTVNTPADNATDLARTLGITAPSQSIADSDRLSNLMEEHNFLSHNLLDIDLVALTDLITQKSDNLLSQQLRAVAETIDAAPTAVCQNEYHAIAKQWPRFVAGYTQYDKRAQSMALKLQAANSNTATEKLQKLRGHISPNYAGDESVFGVALALNVDELAPVLTELWTSATTTQYDCPQLTEMTAALQQTNPMMLGMVTGMAQSLQGISLALTKAPAISNFDDPQLALMQSASALEGTLIVSAGKPEVLGALAQFNPDVASLITAQPGQIVAIEAMPSVQSYASIKGKDIILSVGENAEADLNAMQEVPELVANGILRVDVDVSAYMDMLLSATQVDSDTAETMGLSAADVESIKLLKDVSNFHYESTVDFEAKAITLGATFTPRS